MYISALVMQLFDRFPSITIRRLPCYALQLAGVCLFTYMGREFYFGDFGDGFVFLSQPTVMIDLRDAPRFKRNGFLPADEGIRRLIELISNA